MNYFIAYHEDLQQENINFKFILSVYKIIKANNLKEQKLFFNSYKQLSFLLKIHVDYEISVPTIQRILNNELYYNYFIYDRTNHFLAIPTCHKNFVILCDKEIDFLLRHQDNLLIKYFLYLKYYYGYFGKKPIDDTANQILSALGYSTKSGQTKGRLCEYNKMLQNQGLIFIKKIYDEQGHIRNFYSFSKNTINLPILINEPTIQDYLKHLGLKILTEYRFCNLPQYRFDFFVNNSYIIEYDGEQHFKTTQIFKKENYERTHANDLIKNKYCFEHNIPIIRIPYDEEYYLDDLKLETTRFLLTPENEQEYYNKRKEE